ncbi:hypothetical protein L915_00661, partial [Phytophthora nicotianae]
GVTATGESTQVGLVAKTAPDFVPTQVSPNQLLRTNHEEGNSLLAIDEEQAQFSGLKGVAKELKLRDEIQKKLTVAAAKMKTQTQSQMFNTASKRMKTNPQQAPGNLKSVEDIVFLKIFMGKNNSPEKVKLRGLTKNRGQFTNYEEFYKTMVASA